MASDNRKEKQASDSIATVDRSNLPGLTLSIIAKKLDPIIGHLLLRSVCSSWRLSLLPPPKTLLQFPLDIPGYYLEQCIILRISPPGNPKSQGWLVKLMQQEQNDDNNNNNNNNNNTFSLFYPLHTDAPYLNNPMAFNLLDYGVSYITESYSFNCRKVAVASDFVEDGDFVVMAVFMEYELGFWKLGQLKWTFIMDEREPPLLFSDVVFYNGKFYAIDFVGNIVMIDSSFKPVIITPQVGDSLKLGLPPRTNKFLVGCGGELLVVSEKLVLNEPDLCGDDTDNRCYKSNNNRYDDYDVTVFVPKHGGGGDKYEVLHKQHLNGRSLFIGEDVNFSVLAEDFMGCLEDCVYRYAEYIGTSFRSLSNKTGVYDLKNNKVVDLWKPFELFFWPPPRWFLPYESSLS